MVDLLIKQKITESMKQAMKAQQKERLGVIRLILAAFKQVEVDERIEITDEIALKILDKMQKQRKDSIEQFKTANREDLVNKEEFELTVIREFLPAPLELADIKILITKVIKETNAQSIKDMANVINVIKPTIQGRVDMAEVSKLVKEQLA